MLVPMPVTPGQKFFAEFFYKKATSSFALSAGFAEAKY